MSDQVILSVIIPAYNAEKYLSEAIFSIQNQEWDRKLQIIVVDDGSTDATAQIARQNDCTVISVPNGGAAAARNTGIKAAQGDYIAFLDADDLYTENALNILFHPFEEDPSINVVYGMTKDFISPDLSAQQAASLAPRTEPYTGTLTGSVMIQRSVFDTIGLFDDTIRSAETVEWMMRIRESSLKIIQLDELTCMRRLHLTNTGRVNRKDEMKNYAALLRKRMKRP